MKVYIIGTYDGEHHKIGVFRLNGARVAYAINPAFPDKKFARKLMVGIYQDPLGGVGRGATPDNNPEAWLRALAFNYTSPYLRATMVPPEEVKKEFVESEHPRDDDGKFTEGGGGGAIGGGVEADDTKTWAGGKSPEDQSRAVKLETERQTAISNVAKLLPGVTGQSEGGAPLTSPTQFATWVNMPDDWQTHAANAFMSDYVNSKMPEAQKWATWESVPDEWKGKGKEAYFVPFGDRTGDNGGEYNWQRMSEQEKLDYTQQTFNESQAAARSALTDEAGALWGDMYDASKLHHAQTEVKDFPEIEPPDDDSEQGDDEDDKPKMSVSDFGSWDSLPSDWQDTAQEKWQEDNYAEFEQSEKESYEPDKDSVAESLEGDDDAVHTLIKEIPDESYIYPGVEAEPESTEGAEPDRSEDKRREKEWQDNFDLAASVDDGAFTWNGDGDLTVDTDRLVFRKNPHLDESQQLIPGVDREELSNAYKKAQWASVADDYEKEFAKKWEKAVEKRMEEEVENYEPDEDSIKDYMNDTWESMSDKQKYKHAEQYLTGEEYGGGDNAPEPKPGATGPIREPKAYALFNSDDEQNAGDYRMTGRLGRALVAARAKQIAKERGIQVYSGAGMQGIADRLWEGWKGSSTNAEGMMLQVAAADELGGNLQPWVASEAVSMRAGKNYPAAKAYVRGLWETSQFMMHKAGVKELDVYRGIMFDGTKLEDEPAEEVRTTVEGGQALLGERVSSLNLKQNGAASWTTKRGVANGWDGIGHNMPPNPKRVVLRARVPATAVLALPAYGKNYHEEEEVVVVGTPWKKWDAWKNRAPAIEDANAPNQSAAFKWRKSRA